MKFKVMKTKGLLLSGSVLGREPPSWSTIAGKRFREEPAHNQRSKLLGMLADRRITWLLEQCRSREKSRTDIQKAGNLISMQVLEASSGSKVIAERAVGRTGGGLRVETTTRAGLEKKKGSPGIRAPKWLRLPPGN